MYTIRRFSERANVPFRKKPDGSMDGLSFFVRSLAVEKKAIVAQNLLYSAASTGRIQAIQELSFSLENRSDMHGLPAESPDLTAFAPFVPP